MIILIISIVINLSIIYYFYKKIIAKIYEPEKRYSSEINSLMVEFNKTAKNNFDLMEEKVQEIKNLLQLADEKADRIAQVQAEKKEKGTEKKVKLTGSSKTGSIKKLFTEGKSSIQISRIMGISKSEVDLYLNLLKK